jgi:retron-type reverse transcriptase
MSVNTETADRFLFTRNLAELQRQAGVEREVAELVVAHARLCADKAQPVEFYSSPDTPVPWNYALDKLLSCNPDVDPRARQFLVSYNRLMHARRLPIIYTKEHLAERLGVTPKQLGWLAYGKNRYRVFSIPKSNGEARRVDEPVDKLKTVQHWVLRHVLAKLPTHRAAQGFRHRRSTLTNARKHLNKKVVVRIDLKDFFPSISLKQARRVYLKAGYPYTVANLLANLSTREGVLPIGAPTSPALANQVCRKLDHRLWMLSYRARYFYSRYADDLVFSSYNREFGSLVPFLKQVIIEEGFDINERKVAIARRNGRQMVTGIVVNRRTNLDRERYKWIRAVVHNCLQQGVGPALHRWGERMAQTGRVRPTDTEQFRQQLAGQVAYLRHINPRKFTKLWHQFQEIDFG